MWAFDSFELPSFQFFLQVALLSAPSFASAVQYFIYPGTDLSKIDWSIGKTGDELVVRILIPVIIWVGFSVVL